MKYKYIDLFAGIGGMRIGFSQACKELGYESKCVFSSEWDAKCQDTYEQNFGDRPYGDITEIVKNNLNKIPNHDVLMAGFPCQPFSNAGLKKDSVIQEELYFMILQKFLKQKNLRYLCSKM